MSPVQSRQFCRSVGSAPPPPHPWLEGGVRAEGDVRWPDTALALLNWALVALSLGALVIVLLSTRNRFMTGRHMQWHRHRELQLIILCG